MSAALPQTRAVVRHSLIVGIEELRSDYTLRTWLFGWMLRVVFQVLFFALVGRFVGSPEVVRFLLVGSACAVAVLEALVVVMVTAADRWAGLLPLLVATPGSYFTTYLARNLTYIVTGTATASVSMFIGSALLRVCFPYPDAILVVPIIMLGAMTTYLFGCLLGAIVARTVQGRWLLLNVGNLSMSALCGFLVPVGFWPQPFTAMAEVLPFTHALRAIRGVLSESPTSSIVAQCGIEVLVAAGWFVVARASFTTTIERARRDGSIELNP